MSLSSPERHRRAGRKLAISVAALALCVLPTACDYAVASPPGTPTAPTDHSGHDGNAVTTAPVVVPIVNQTSTQEERRRGERRRTRTRTRTATPTVAPVETTTTPVETTTPPVETTTPPVDTTTPPVGPTPPVDTATTAPTGTTTAPAPPPVVAAPLEVLGRDCAKSTLIAHDGFQKSPACVSTSMGEVAAEDRLPSLLITAAPKTVAVGQTFMLEVSTRNLIRDRFLGAAAGGYYLESSFLDPASGLQRGHFHTACRLLASTTVAPDSSPAPAFFVATQDKGGSAKPDTVTIEVKGATATAGELQCTSWAGDGSHRTPMMTKANQTPAIDSVRITVGGNAPAGAVAPQPDVSAADAQRDEAALVEGQQAEAGAQKPDQDGAVQPGAQDTVPQAVETGAPAATPDAASSSTPTPTVEESAGN